MDALAEAVARAFAAAGVTSVEHVSACLANADLPVEEEQLAAALMRVSKSSVDVRNDTFALPGAGVDEPLGVAVVCGAGVNCVGSAPDGRTARFPAIGRLSATGAAAGGLAEEALWHAARAADGARRAHGTGPHPAGPLRARLDAYALIEALHLRHIEPVRRHELTPRAVRHGGGTATRSPRRSSTWQADEVVAMATVAPTRLDLLMEETPVLLGGSRLLAARHPQLDDRIRNLLTYRAPQGRTPSGDGTPRPGRGLLGLGPCGSIPGAHTRVRAHFAT